MPSYTDRYTHGEGEGLLTEADEAVAALRAEVARLKDGWRQEVQDRRAAFDQSCKNLKRAERAEAEVAGLRALLDETSRMDELSNDLRARIAAVLKEA